MPSAALGQAIKITRSVHIESVAGHPASVVGISYASSARLVFIESVVLPSDGPCVRCSEDNGKTWTICERWKEQEPLEGDRYLQRDLPACFFLGPDNGRLFRVFYTSEAIRGVVPWDSRAPQGKTLHVFIQISKDEGKTWCPPQQVVQKGAGYDDKHWADGFWHGKNGAAVEGAHVMKLNDGTLLMPFWGFRLHENGSILSGEGRRTQVSGCFLGKWRADGSAIDWDMGEATVLPRKYSDDGADEPSIDYLADGRLFMIIRARVCMGSKAELPGLKYYSLSSDGGRTWSEGAPLLYDDGSYPYSPACLGNVFRSKKNGRFYLITNLNAAPGENCDPRTTLQIAEIDQKTLRLIKSTVTPIESRAGDQPAYIRFSNYRWYEDRETQNIVLFMTANPGNVGRKPGDNIPRDAYRYDIELPKP